MGGFSDGFCHPSKVNAFGRLFCLCAGGNSSVFWAELRNGEIQKNGISAVLRKNDRFLLENWDSWKKRGP
jgi:hypothetical protein